MTKLDDSWHNMSLRNELTFEFAKPPGATQANLVIDAATSQWGSIMMRQMMQARGNRLADWYASVDERGLAMTELLNFNQREEQMLPMLFQEGGGRATSDLAIRVLQGRGVGGSTIHNTNLCKRTPDPILELWAARHGVEGASPGDMRPAFERIGAHRAFRGRTWEVALAPRVYWEAGVREPGALDDAVARDLATVAAALIAAPARNSGRLVGPEGLVRARARDDEVVRSSLLALALWGSVALAAAAMIGTALYQTMRVP